MAERPLTEDHSRECYFHISFRHTSEYDKFSGARADQLARTSHIDQTSKRLSPARVGRTDATNQSLPTCSGHVDWKDLQKAHVRAIEEAAQRSKENDGTPQVGMVVRGR